MIDRVLKEFKDEDKAKLLIERIHGEKPRYIRDQLMILDSVVTSSTETAVNKALDYCINNKLFSAMDFRDAVNHYSKIVAPSDTISPGSCF